MHITKTLYLAQALALLPAVTCALQQSLVLRTAEEDQLLWQAQDRSSSQPQLGVPSELLNMSDSFSTNGSLSSPLSHGQPEMSLSRQSDPGDEDADIAPHLDDTVTELNEFYHEGALSPAQDAPPFPSSSSSSPRELTQAENNFLSKLNLHKTLKSDVLDSMNKQSQECVAGYVAYMDCVARAVSDVMYVYNSEVRAMGIMRFIPFMKRAALAKARHNLESAIRHILLFTGPIPTIGVPQEVYEISPSRYANNLLVDITRPILTADNGRFVAEAALQAFGEGATWGEKLRLAVLLGATLYVGNKLLQMARLAQAANVTKAGNKPMKKAW